MTKAGGSDEQFDAPADSAVESRKTGVIDPAETPAVPTRLENASAPSNDEVLRRLKQVAACK
jgi:hypothetical protein